MTIIRELSSRPSVLKRESSVFYGVTARRLLKINEDGQTKENLKNLEEIGGVEELCFLLQSDLDNGLHPSKFDQRRLEFGTNDMPVPESKTWLELFLGSFEDTTLIILIISATVSLAVGVYGDPSKGWIEGTAILTAVLIVAIVTATNDYSKDKQFRALNAIKDNITVQVVRDGERTQISTTEVLVGDIVFLESGDKIPADGIMVRGTDVTVNESSLTGEPEDVRKGTKKDEDPFLLSGCVLTGGSCDMLVIAVGAESRWGRIRAKLQEEPSDTPLQEKLDVMAKQIGYVGIFAAIATFIATMVVHFCYPSRTIDSDILGESVDTHFEHVLHAFIISVTIVVVAVPEGLPLAVTISLAYSTKKMLKDQNLIRVLSACETMGNATNICSDKTGTLTENRMTVVAGWFAGIIEGNPSDSTSKVLLPSEISKKSRDIISEGIAVNTTAWLKKISTEDGSTTPRGRGPEVVGSKTEGALLLLIEASGTRTQLIRNKKLSPEKGDKVFTFSSDRKRMTTILNTRDDSENNSVVGSQQVYCKGAAEIILGLCSSMLTKNGDIVSIDDDDRKKLMTLIENYGSLALRTVGLAHKSISKEKALNLSSVTPDQVECNLTLDCLVGIKDPLREDVTEAVQLCQSAGIMVRMVTGDNINTAKAIARECSILSEDGLAMEGPEFRKLTPQKLDEILPKLQVLARSSPQDKYLLVSRLNGHGLPKNREEWEAVHPELDWEIHRKTALPGYYDEWVKSRPFGGEVVGATGDGTNDAPALKTADVGLSMGLTGTDVAKDASDIVIMDDNFSSIVKAVLWGRCVFDNIRKFLQFQLTVNVVALTITFMGALTGYEPPLNAIMMLWVNLIMDTMGALALGTEAPNETLLLRLPLKRTASLISAQMWRHILVQSAYQLCLLSWLLIKGAKIYGVEDGEEHHFTIIFTTFVFCQVFNEFNSRSISNDWNVFKGLSGNPMFQGVIIFTVVAQEMLVEYGGNFTKTESLTTDQWIGAVLLGALALPLGVMMRQLPPSRESPSHFSGYPELQKAALSKRLNGSGEKQPRSEGIFSESSGIEAWMVTMAPIAGIIAYGMKHNWWREGSDVSTVADLQVPTF